MKNGKIHFVDLKVMFVRFMQNFFFSNFIVLSLSLREKTVDDCLAYHVNVIWTCDVICACIKKYHTALATIPNYFKTINQNTGCFVTF